MSESIMFKILGDKIPQRVLNTQMHIPSTFSQKPRLKPRLEPTVNFEQLFFAGSDIQMIKVIYPHQFFKNTFRIRPFRLTGCFLNGVLKIVKFFKSPSVADMEEHLAAVGLMFGYLDSHIEMFDFFTKFLQKMSKFCAFIKRSMEGPESTQRLDFEVLKSLHRYARGRVE